MRSCYQCGKDLDELGKNRKAIYCSTKCKCKFLRENDPTIGYTEENTRVVVWLYNAAKNVFNDSDVLLMATALVNKDGSMKSERSKRERKKT